MTDAQTCPNYEIRLADRQPVRGCSSSGCLPDCPSCKAKDASIEVLVEALMRWQKLAEGGYRRRGVGIGSVTIRKWDADEALFWTRKALATYGQAGDELVRLRRLVNETLSKKCCGCWQRMGGHPCDCECHEDIAALGEKENPPTDTEGGDEATSAD